MAPKILVVDDQMGVRRLLFEAFKEDGYDVDMAASGLEAINKVRTSSPKLVLMDMKMPGMNGLEALREIKKINRNLAVIMMTAYGELDVINQALKLGVKTCINKPFDLNELKSLIEQILSEQQVG
ncbi:MAG TPA: response regulator [Desulfobacteria bacterium]|nr:response regulator [Desulfobacteria bacterium]